MQIFRNPEIRGICVPAIVCGLVVALGMGTPVYAHGIFKKTLEKKYDQLKVTCNMCHVPKEKKTKRNEFGGLFYEELKGQDLSARWEAVKGEERKTLEKEVMAPAFLKALEKVGEKENADHLKYAELIPAGKIAGSKPKSSGDSGDDDDDDDDDDDQR
jgi:hypothetical protein